MKRISVLLFLLMVSVVLVGCMEVGVDLEIEPDPMNFSEDSYELDGTIRMKTTGFGDLEIYEIIILVEDVDKEEIVYTDSDVVEEELFVFSGITHEESFTLHLEEIFEDFDDDYYVDELKGAEYELTVQLEGSVDSSKTVTINFE